MSEKLSQSKVSGRFCNVKSEPLPEDIQDKLEKASKAANGKIRRNNKVYETSNAHAKNYPVN